MSTWTDETLQLILEDMIAALKAGRVLEYTISKPPLYEEAPGTTSLTIAILLANPQTTTTPSTLTHEK